MRLSVWLDDDAREALDLLSRGRRGKAAVVREALLLAARLQPLTERLDRVETLLRSGASVQPVTQAPQESSTTAQDDALARLRGWANDD